MNKSDNIGKLALALSKFQSEARDTQKDKKGYGYNYSDLSGVLEIVRPLCAKYELSVTQLCENSDRTDVVGVTTVLMHGSGEWISSTIYMPVQAGKGMSLSQAAGSCITYARRYALAAILGITQTDNDASLNRDASAKPSYSSAPKAASSPVSQRVDLKKLGGLIVSKKVLESEIDGWVSKAGVNGLGGLNQDQVAKLIVMLEAR